MHRSTLLLSHSPATPLTVPALYTCHSPHPSGENHFEDSKYVGVPSEKEDIDTLTRASAAGNGEAHRAAVRRCACSGIPLTIHAGESGPAANVAASASAQYGSARRIGHGYAAVAEALDKCEVCEPEQVAAAFEQLGIPSGLTFEMCPTSSRCTSGWTGQQWDDHPAAVLSRLHRSANTEAAARLPRVVISSDDPAVFATSLTDEILLVASAEGGMGLGEAGVHDCMLSAVNASFLAVEAKSQLRARFDAAWEAWQTVK